VLQERDGDAYNNDCAEIFLLPSLETRRYWEILVAPSGSLFDALHEKKPDAWGAEPGGDRKTMNGLLTGQQMQGTNETPGDTDTGYTIEVAVPWDELPDRKKGSTDPIFIRLVRGDRQGKAIKFYAYQPLLSWCHNIWNYGKLELGD
jgi:hypothetical protein